MRPYVLFYDPIHYLSPLGDFEYEYGCWACVVVFMFVMSECDAWVWLLGLSVECWLLVVAFVILFSILMSDLVIWDVGLGWFEMVICNWSFGPDA